MKKILFLLFAVLLCSTASAIETMRIKQGDTLPVYRVYIVKSSGTYVDLTGCTVTASMRADGNTVNAFSKAAAIISAPTADHFDFYFNATQTARAGTYTLQFTVSESAGTFTIPTGTTAPVIIEKKY